jgi:hypothetical protein
MSRIPRVVSHRISELYVNPAFDPALYGHGDLFMANDAADVIWRPILNWIQEH